MILHSSKSYRSYFQNNELKMLCKQFLLMILNYWMFADVSNTSDLSARFWRFSWTRTILRLELLSRIVKPGRRLSWWTLGMLVPGDLLHCLYCTHTTQMIVKVHSTLQWSGKNSVHLFKYSTLPASYFAHCCTLLCLSQNSAFWNTLFVVRPSVKINETRILARLIYSKKDYDYVWKIYLIWDFSLWMNHELNISDIQIKSQISKCHVHISPFTSDPKSSRVLGIEPTVHNAY